MTWEYWVMLSLTAWLCVLFFDQRMTAKLAARWEQSSNEWRNLADSTARLLHLETQARLRVRAATLEDAAKHIETMRDIAAPSPSSIMHPEDRRSLTTMCAALTVVAGAVRGLDTPTPA